MRVRQRGEAKALRRAMLTDKLHRRAIGHVPQRNNGGAHADSGEHARHEGQEAGNAAMRALLLELGAHSVGFRVDQRHVTCAANAISFAARAWRSERELRYPKRRWR